MRQLLNEKDIRRLNLLEKIYLNPELTIAELADLTAISELQIQADLGFLESFIEPIFFNIDKNHRVALIFPMNLSFKIIYQKFLEKSLAFQILEKILINEKYNYEELAKQLYISVATLKRTIKNINDVFAKYNMEIKTRPLRIVGSEANVRLFFILYFQEKYPDDVPPFENKGQILIHGLADDLIFAITDKSLAYADMKRIYLYLYIISIRVINQHTKDSSNKKVTPDIQEFYEKWTKKYYFELIFHQEFTIELCAELYNFLAEKFIEPVNTNNHLYQQLEGIILELAESYLIPYGDLNELIGPIYQILRNTTEITVPPYILSPNRKNFLLQSNFLQVSVLQKVKELYTKYLPEVAIRNEGYFYEFLYFLVIHWQELYTFLLKNIKPFKIGIFFNSDIGNMHYVAQDLSFTFGSQILCEIMECHTLEDFYEHSISYDLILLNFILSDDQKIKAPHLCVLDVLSEHDLQKIASLINQQNIKLLSNIFK